MATIHSARVALLLFLFGAFAPAPSAAAEPSQGGPPLHEWLLGRGRIGIRVQELSPELREHFGAPADRGVLVSEVEPGRPAEKAGLRVGDVILEVDGAAVESPGQLAGVIRRAPKGGRITLSLLRKGKRRSVEVEPEDPAPLIDPETEEWIERFGRQLEEGGQHLERRLRELERRIEELQRDVDERLEQLEGGDGQKT